MVWITEWSHCPSSAINIVVSDDELHAFASAAFMIMNTIHEEWDLADPLSREHALFISDQFAALNWKDAIQRFNECESKRSNQQVKVYERKTEHRFYPIKLLRELPHTKEFDLESFLKDSEPPPSLG